MYQQTPEGEARLMIDDQLKAAGWVVQSLSELNLYAARGVAVKGVNIGDVKPTPIPIPPLAEQHQIVAEVEARTTAIDHLEAELNRQISRSNRLRQSTLSDAFIGKL